MSPHIHPALHHRQPQGLASDGSTVVPVPTDVAGSSLVADPNQTGGIISGLSAPALTVTSSLPSTPTPTPTAAVPTPTAKEASKSGLATGAIIGIVVGIFVVLAVALVTFMNVRHRKAMAQRKKERAAKARAAGKEGKGDAMQMREKPSQSQSRGAPGQGGNGADIAYPPAPPAAVRDSHDGDSSFLSLKSTHSLQRLPPIAPQSNNPFLPYLPSQNLAALSESNSPTQADAPYAQHHGYSAQQAQYARQTPAPIVVPPADDHTIPNPFGSPTPSRTPSQSTHAHNESLDLEHLASFPAVQFANNGINISPDPQNPTFSLSEYTDDSASFTDAAYASGQSSQSPKESKATIKKPKVKAMQDLISALDGPTNTPMSSAPSSWLGPAGGSVATGKSRLSLGEGLVTPVEENSGSHLTAHADPASIATPLPPSEMFRAALALDSEKKDSNPFA